jgi:hypothetical protein
MDSGAQIDLVKQRAVYATPRADWARLPKTGRAQSAFQGASLDESSAVGY